MEIAIKQNHRSDIQIAHTNWEKVMTMNNAQKWLGEMLVSIVISRNIYPKAWTNIVKDRTLCNSWKHLGTKDQSQ